MQKNSSMWLLPTTISFSYCESDVSVSKIVLHFKNIKRNTQFTTTHKHGLHNQKIHMRLYKLVTMPRGWESTMPTNYLTLSEFDSWKRKDTVFSTTYTFDLQPIIYWGLFTGCKATAVWIWPFMPFYATNSERVLLLHGMVSN